MSTAYEWKSDPTWRFEERFFAGQMPTDRVRDNGVESIDPEGPGAPPVTGTDERGASLADAIRAPASVGAPAPVVPAALRTASATIELPPAVLRSGSPDLLDDLFNGPAAAASPVATAPPPAAPSPVAPAGEAFSALAPSTAELAADAAEPAPRRRSDRSAPSRRSPAGTTTPRSGDQIERLDENDPARLRARLVGAASGGAPLAPKTALARPYATSQVPFEDVDPEPSIAADLFARDSSVPPPMRSPGRADARGFRPSRQPHRSRGRARLVARVLLVLALLGTLGGVLTVQWKKRQADAHGSWAKAWDPRVQSLATFVEGARGARFDHAVTVEFLSDVDFARALATPASRARESGAAALAVLGLDEPLAAASTVSSAGGREVVGAYSSTKRRITVRGTTLTSEVRTTLVHELTHAWQDQHFGLERLVDAAYTEGERTGLQVALEGDAELVAQAYATTLNEATTSAAEPATFDERSAMSVARDRLAYELGPLFMANVIQRGGPDARDGVFDRLPRSDLEVLDPAAYLGGLQVQNVPPPAIDASDSLLGGARPSEIGVLAWFTLLASRIEPRAAFAAVQGWLGDAAVVFTRSEKPCVRAMIATAGTDAQARLADAFVEWGALAPGDDAKVVRTGTNVELTICSGRKIRSAGIELDVYVIRNAATAAATTEHDGRIARCEAESLITVTNRSDLVSLRQPSVLGPKLQEFAARCST